VRDLALLCWQRIFTDFRKEDISHSTINVFSAWHVGVILMPPAVRTTQLPDMSADAVIGESQEQTAPISTWDRTRMTSQFEVIKLSLADERGNRVTGWG
jgi:hypothetical protein